MTSVSNAQTAKHATQRKRYEWVWHAIALLVPVPLALLLTYPVITEPAVRVPGWAGDNIVYIWLIDHLREVVVNGAALFFDPHTYYPLGYNVASIELSLANSVLVLPFTLLFGPVAAYNAALLLSFMLTSYGMFLWARSITHNHLAALLCGIACAFLPFRIAHLPGHLPQMATQWIPLCFFAIERALSTRRVRWAVVAGVFFALNALASWYTLVFMALAVPVYVLLRVRGVWLLRHWRAVAAGALAAGVLIAPLAVPYLNAQSGSDRSRSVTDMMYCSVNPVEFITLSRRHPLWGDWATANLAITQNQNEIERIVMPGYAMLLTAGVGIILSRRRRIAVALGGLALLGAFGAMGPILADANGKPVTIPLSAPTLQWLDQAGAIGAMGNWFGADIAAEMRASSATVIPLPYALIYRLPVISSIRCVGRYAIVMNFAAVGLAALGLDALRRRAASARALRYIVVLSLIVGGVSLLEYWQTPWLTVRLAAREVDIWLQAQPRGAVLELPLTAQSLRLNNFSRMVHRQPLVLGLAGSFPPPADAIRKATLERLPDAAAVDEVCSWGTRYVVFNTRRINAEQHQRWQRAIEALPQAHLARVYERERVYVVDGCAPR